MISKIATCALIAAAALNGAQAADPKATVALSSSRGEAFSRADENPIFQFDTVAKTAATTDALAYNDIGGLTAESDALSKNAAAAVSPKAISLSETNLFSFAEQDGSTFEFSQSSKADTMGVSDTVAISTGSGNADSGSLGQATAGAFDIAFFDEAVAASLTKVGGRARAGPAAGGADSETFTVNDAFTVEGFNPNFFADADAIAVGASNGGACYDLGGDCGILLGD